MWPHYAHVNYKLNRIQKGPVFVPLQVLISNSSLEILDGPTFISQSLCLSLLQGIKLSGYIELWAPSTQTNRLKVQAVRLFITLLRKPPLSAAHSCALTCMGLCVPVLHWVKGKRITVVVFVKLCDPVCVCVCVCVAFTAISQDCLATTGQTFQSIT